jgi:hypothetical protein
MRSPVKRFLILLGLVAGVAHIAVAAQRGVPILPTQITCTN